MPIKQQDLILASTSPRRQQLMHAITDSFKVIQPDFEERRQPQELPIEYVQRNALGKALSIANSLPKQADFAIIGADTVVVIDNQVLEKPTSQEQAYTMLQLLSNKTHQVYTGFAIAHKTAHSTLDTTTAFVETQVTFKPLSAEQIQQYIQTGEPMDKAGGYAIQGQAASFIEKIEGSLNNVIGFPVEEIQFALQQHLGKLPS